MEEQQGIMEYSSTKWRTGFLRATLIAASILGLFTLLPSLVNSNPIYPIAYTVFYTIILSVTFLRINDDIKAGVLIIILFLVALASLTETGIQGGARLFLLGTITLACLLFSWKTGYLVLVFGFITCLLFGWLILNGNFKISSTSVQPGNLNVWVSNVTSLVMLSALIINAIRLVQTEFTHSEERAVGYLNNLTKERSSLELRIQERTKILDKRTSQLQAVADVGKSVTSYRNLSELLQQAANLIHQNFGYYHIGIFLLDERKEFAVLTGTNSEGGKIMLDKGHFLKVGETGIVGYVAETLQARIALDVGEDAVFFNNPDLPNTRSELALPLVAGGQILGVLDVQSTEPSAFVEDDIATLQILAEQLAVAIQNANLFAETARALDSARATYGQMSREAWSKMLRSQVKIGYLATPPATIQVQGDTSESGVAKAIETGDLILGTDGLTISVPVKIRGQVIGAIRLKKSEIAEAWTQDEINLAISLSDQLSGALESARLYRDSLQRAARESLVSEISNRINTSATRDAILRETVQELGQSIGSASVTFHLVDHLNSRDQLEEIGRGANTPSNE